MKISSSVMKPARSALAAAAVLAGFGLGDGRAIADDKPLVVARAFDVNSLDPARAWCDTCVIYLSNVYETLLTLDKDNKTLKPELAVSWEANADQTQFTFKLDPDALFSDGTPVESKDVKFSFERLKNVKGGPSFFMDGLKSIEAPEPKTVVVTTEAPNSEFLNILSSSYAGVQNSDVALANGATAAADADKTDGAEAWFQTNSIGSGPYVLAGFKPDEELRFGSNPHYKRTTVNITNAVLTNTKDSVSQAQMLESGAADIAMQIDADTAKQLPADTVVVEAVPSPNFVYVALSPGAKGNKVPLTKEIREAISLSLDYDGIIDFTTGGAGKPQASPIPNGFPGTEGLPMPKQDLDKAKAILEKAGLSGGFEIDATFPNVNSFGVDFTLMMQKVQQDLARVGIKALIQPVEMSVWRTQIRADGIPLSGVFYAPDYFGSAQYVQYFGMIEGSPWWKRAGGERDPSVVNPKETQLLKQVLAAPEDKKEELYHAIALEMISDKIILPLVSPDIILAYRKGVEGVRFSACCLLPLDEISRK
ncbi:ABC transporter substrate-binding protein [Corticibacterium sp. UT-5YL-CI-8]|nr:ABC transporter substrate-binding protein [Tianweitania sp. UT-5YL-CI-8]